MSDETNLSPYIQNATELTAHYSYGPLTRMLPVSLTLDNYIAQIAAVAPIDTSGPFVDFNPTRLPQITLGAGGVATVYTLTGTDIITGKSFTQTINATGAGTFKAAKPMRITRLQSDVNPAGTTDLQGGDTWVHPPSRAINVGVAGDIVCRPMDNNADITLHTQPTGISWVRQRIIRITGTSAADLSVGW
jgi:hypothetical protein